MKTTRAILERLKKAPNLTWKADFQLLWEINQNPMASALCARFRELNQENVATMLNGNTGLYNMEWAVTVEARAAAGLQAIEFLINANDAKQLSNRVSAPGNEWASRKGSSEYGSSTSLSAAMGAFIEVLIEPTIQYLEDQTVTLSRLESTTIEYKQRSEWFDAERLKRIAEEMPEAGQNLVERRLKNQFAKYLFDEGFRFALEAEEESAYGKVDIFLIGPDENRLGVVEVKVFDGADRNADHVKEGVGQAAHYAAKFTAPNPYLLVFNVTEPQLHINGTHTNNYWVVPHGTTRVRVITVDVGMQKSPSSKEYPDPKVISLR